MKVVAYGDIHHDEYTNGLTLDDTLAVERQVTQHCVDQGIKFVLNLGDWYRATNPLQSVAVAAEATWVERSRLGIQTCVLVGNHDRWTKNAMSGHAFARAGVMTRDLEGVRVFDRVESFRPEPDVEFVMVPSGQEGLMEPRHRPPDVRCRLVAFHGLLKGSFFAGTNTAQDGVDPEAFKQLRADLILGGDNHTSQRLDSLLGVPSMYLGAPLQHGWGDIGQVRGFWEIDTDMRVAPKLVPTRSPRFVRIQVDGDNIMMAAMRVAHEVRESLAGNPGIVEVTVVGAALGSLDTSVLAEAAKSAGARTAKVLLKHTTERLRLVHDFGALQTPEDKWRAYLSKVDTGTLSPARIMEATKRVLKQAEELAT